MTRVSPGPLAGSTAGSFSDTESARSATYKASISGITSEESKMQSVLGVDPGIVKQVEVQERFKQLEGTLCFRSKICFSHASQDVRRVQAPRSNTC